MLLAALTMGWFFPIKTKEHSQQGAFRTTPLTSQRKSSLNIHLKHPPITGGPCAGRTWRSPDLPAMKVGPLLKAGVQNYAGRVKPQAMASEIFSVRHPFGRGSNGPRQLQASVGPAEQS